MATSLVAGVTKPPLSLSLKKQHLGTSGTLYPIQNRSRSAGSVLNTERQWSQASWYFLKLIVGASMPRSRSTSWHRTSASTFWWSGLCFGGPLCTPGGQHRTEFDENGVRSKNILRADFSLIFHYSCIRCRANRWYWFNRIYRAYRFYRTTRCCWFYWSSWNQFYRSLWFNWCNWWKRKYRKHRACWFYRIYWIDRCYLFSLNLDVVINHLHINIHIDFDWNCPNVKAVSTLQRGCQVSLFTDEKINCSKKHT